MNINPALMPGFEPAPIVKALINIGALLDVPTGYWVKGKYGESILNGGLGNVTGVVGIGNNFKSTLMHYMMFSAMAKICEQQWTTGSTYDTEINVHEDHLQTLANRFDVFKDVDLFANKIWTNTDTTKGMANVWYEKLKDFLNTKKKARKDLEVDTPFPDRDGQLMKILIPTFGEIDSFTEFKSDAEDKMLQENELGDSGANTFHMRAGLIKTRFLMEAPTILASGNHYLAMTGQLGKDIPIGQSGPPGTAQPVKKLQFLKNGDKIKGVTDKFTFATNNCWHAHNATPLINQSTKAAEYPVQGADPISGDTDLMLVTLRQLRSKAGSTGYAVELVVSQAEGVLPSLSEFHFIKSHDRFGLEGNLQHYSLALYPECKLQRTTVRSKIDSDPLLRRALNITSELLQMHLFHRNLEKDLMSAQELYQKIKEKGYDWNVLLQTRGWWTINNDKHKVPFLSTMDLLNMAHGEYHPYWLEADKKTMKKEFQS